MVNVVAMGVAYKRSGEKRSYGERIPNHGRAVLTLKYPSKDLRNEPLLGHAKRHWAYPRGLPNRLTEREGSWASVRRMSLTPRGNRGELSSRLSRVGEAACRNSNVVISTGALAPSKGGRGHSPPNPQSRGNNSPFV